MEMFLKWSAENPGLFLGILVTAYMIAILAFRLMRRYIRHLDIQRHGWPPAPLDADGNLVDRYLRHLDIQRHGWPTPPIDADGEVIT